MCTRPRSASDYDKICLSHTKITARLPVTDTSRYFNNSPISAALKCFTVHNKACSSTRRRGGASQHLRVRWSTRNLAAFKGKCCNIKTCCSSQNTCCLRNPPGRTVSVVPLQFGFNPMKVNHHLLDPWRRELQHSVHRLFMFLHLEIFFIFHFILLMTSSQASSWLPGAERSSYSFHFTAF